MHGDNVTSKQLADVGTTKAVVFEETISPDEAYAVGWTILPQNKSKPIDWSKWNADDAQKVDDFIDGYVPDPIVTATPQDKYRLINCLIDLKGKSYLELPTDDPDFPHKNRGEISVTWGAPGQEVRYALVKSDARFSTENLWFIQINAAGMHQDDKAGELAKAVEGILDEKRPARTKGYETLFFLSDGETPAVMATLKGDIAVIPFASDIMKSDFATSSVEGILTVHLPDGKVIKTFSDTAVDDPYKADPVLARADRDLNATYAKLAKTLAPEDRAALKKEQLDWIGDRDAAGGEAMEQAVADNGADPLVERNKALINSTQKRLAELQKRLKSTAR